MTFVKLALNKRRSMMNMRNEILRIWNGLKTPSNPLRYSTHNIPKTNAWIYKNYLGGMGFLLSGVSLREKLPSLENITFNKEETKIITNKNTPESRLSRCIEINLDPSCDASLLARILDTMLSEEASGRFSTPLLISVIHRVMELVRRPPQPPKKEEVIGAWGELYLLYNWLRKENLGGDQQQRLLQGWEASPTNRAIIDFTFPHIEMGTAIEVKTSTQGRTHHLHGFGQVTPPDNFKNGWIASVHISETSTYDGKTCQELVEQIQGIFSESKEWENRLSEIFEKKLSGRGLACFDDRFAFQTTNRSVRYICMKDIAQPAKNPDIIDVEWSANVERCPEVKIQDSQYFYIES